MNPPSVLTHWPSLPWCGKKNAVFTFNALLRSNLIVYNRISQRISIVDTKYINPVLGVLLQMRIRNRKNLPIKNPKHNKYITEIDT